MSSAGEFLGDLVDVYCSAAAEAGAGGVVFLFDEQDGDFDGFDLLGFVDHVFDLGAFGVGLIDHVGGDVHNGESVVAKEFEGLEHKGH